MIRRLVAWVPRIHNTTQPFNEWMIEKARFALSVSLPCPVLGRRYVCHVLVARGDWCPCVLWEG